MESKMRFFFRSRQFKIIISVVAVIAAISIICGVIGGVIAPQANLAGAVAAPFQSIATKISNTVSDFFKAYSDGNEMMLENAELSREIADLREKLAEYDRTASENEFYKNYLEIKDSNPDFQFAPATLIARDTDDPYKGFTVNKGSLNGIKEHDPVITEDGLVGYISEVGLSVSKVTTVLSADITLGALDNRTSDSGIVSGELSLAKDGNCKFYNLSRSCNIAIGDYVVTSGEGIFPDGLLIGTIETIGSDKYNTSIYATVKPFVDIDGIRGVMVITDFDGKGGVVPGSGEK